MALLMLAFILGEQEMESLGMSILIMLETLIKEGPLQSMVLPLVVVLSIGKLLRRIRLRCLLRTEAEYMTVTEACKEAIWLKA